MSLLIPQHYCKLNLLAPGYLNVRAERVARAVGALSVERGPGVRETPLLRKERGRGEVVNPRLEAYSATT